jgi:capsular polysaccharide biosynthesis protein
MNKILKLDFVSETNVVTITASSDVPKEAADIANAIADRYKAMRDFEEDRGKNRGEDSIADRQPQEGPVLILSRAQTPPVPDKFFAYLVTILAAGLLSVMAASFVEMIFLFLRAAERTDN